MKCSIALAVWNGARYLPEQLESFAGQTRLPDELVVCDNGSTDGTQDLVKAFAARAPFPVRLHQNETNVGYANNFARATSLCSHELVFWSDCDDWWLPEKLRVFCDRFERDPSLLLLFSDSELVDDRLRPLGGTVFSANGFTPEQREWVRAGEGWRVFARHNVVPGNTLAFRAEVGRVLRSVPKGIVHDAWLLTTVSAMGKIDFLEQPYVRYRIHSGQNVSVITGSPLRSLRARWQRARALDRRRWIEEAARYAAYLAQPEIAAHEGLRDILTRKKRWFEGRSRLSRWRLARIPFVLAHAGDYRSFENGLLSMLKDLLLS